MTDAMIALTRKEAQWLAVIASGLDRRTFRRRVTEDDILATITRLGSIQLDTISVISRSHETVLWSRLGPYDLELWQALYDGEQRITEYWAHAAAIIPRADLPLFRSHMERRGARDWFNHPEKRVTIDRVLDRIGTEGPLGSRHFETPEGAAPAAAWEWYGAKPEREVLSGLWTAGKVVLSLRDRGFGRTWDLAERAIPELWTSEVIADDVRDRTFICRAVRALGVTTARWASDYYRTSGQAYVPLGRVRPVLDDLEGAGAIVRVNVDGIEGAVWMDATLLDRLTMLRQGAGTPRLTTFLSPFDNLIWNRDRMERLWNFAYRLECYVPAPKRRYGYYTMPILHRGQLVGRIDPSYDRRTKTLTIKALHLEPATRPTNALAVGIVGSIESLLRFLGGTPRNWTIQNCPSPAILPLIAEARRLMPPRTEGSGTA
ncbi:MAG: winged helix DNA-binding domain-containing protein [Chloroflexota bacterium]|nr:winged helix DNA-binding domain-containing protein [Chloroflexota bacterium]